MIITATELKNNIGKLLQISQSEDILIMRNGKLVSKLIKVETEDEISIKMEAFKKTGGFLKKAKDADIQKLREERILGK
jgi:antitoxin (DNA-binding transcriptional repressor) of toxin-antitoxin stability system